MSRVGGEGESGVERAARNAQERDESPFMKDAAPNGRVGVGVEPRCGLVSAAENEPDEERCCGVGRVGVGATGARGWGWARGAGAGAAAGTGVGSGSRDDSKSDPES